MHRLTLTGEANPQPLLNRLQETTDPFAVFDRGAGGLCTGGRQPSRLALTGRVRQDLCPGDRHQPR